MRCLKKRSWMSVCLSILLVVCMVCPKLYVQASEMTTADTEELQQSTETESEIQTETESTPEPESTAETESKSSTETESASETATESTAETEAESSTETEPASETEPESIPETETETESEHATEVEPASETENTTETEMPKETEAESATETETESSESTYEEKAASVLEQYGTRAAFQNEEQIDSSYFLIQGLEAGDQAPSEYTVETGTVSEETVPQIEGYDFINATIRGAEVKSIGKLLIDRTEYIYYRTTEESSSGLSASVLAENEKIVLNYEKHVTRYAISYDLEGDVGEITPDEIFGEERPTQAGRIGNYTFQVTIPRGYTGTVKINGAVVDDSLGREPTYVKSGNTVINNGETEKLLLSGTYERTNVSSDQQITVVLTKRNSYTFSAALWTQTVFASGRASFGTLESTFVDVEETETKDLWTFTTNVPNRSINWVLDSLQVNGTKLHIPFVENMDGSPNVSTVTELPEGTVVTVTLTKVWPSGGQYCRTYVVSVSNCHENITITGGNLYNYANWQEIMVDRLTGVELQVYGYRGASGKEWRAFGQSIPFSTGTGNVNRNYIFESQASKLGLRFKLKDGYINPKVVQLNAGTGEDLGNILYYPAGSTAPVQDEDGWCYFSISGQGGKKYSLLRIEAEIARYDVVYQNEETEVSEAVNLPDYDNSGYNTVEAGKSDIVISNRIPSDSQEKYVFQYWTLKNDPDQTVIYPNARVDLETVRQYGVWDEEKGRYVLNYIAHWKKVEQAEQISYHVEFWTEDADGVSQKACLAATHQAPKGSKVVIDTDADEIVAFLEEHPQYDLDRNKTHRYRENIQNGDVLQVWFKEVCTDVTVSKKVTGGLGDVEKKFQFEAVVNDRKMTFELKDQEQTVLKNLPIGAILRIQETDGEGYQITINGQKTETMQPVSMTVEKGLSVEVINHKEAIPQTGVTLTSFPELVLLGAAAAGTAGELFRKRRRRRRGKEEEEEGRDG